MLNKHPILILLFVMLTGLAFAATTVTANHTIYDPDGVEQDVAIVGYTVHFDVTVDTDATTIDSVKIKSDNIIGETESFGLTLARRVANSYAGDYVVTAGDVNEPLDGDIYQVFVFVDGSSVPLNTTESYNLLIDNQIPFVTNGNSTHIESVPAGKSIFGIGDEMKFVFNRDWNGPTEDVIDVKLDLTSIGGPAELATTRNGNLFTATYVLTELEADRMPGPISTGYIPSITIPMIMTDQWGNVSVPHPSNVITGDVNGDPYPADRMPPTLGNISDLYDNDQFRFSPGNDMMGDWDTNPNTISAKIDIPGFGQAGNASAFEILVQNENTDTNVGYIEFAIDDPTVSINGDVITFVWDGKVNNVLLDEAVYGLTLVSMMDNAGNSVTLTPLPPVVNPNIADGETELNVLDFVLDNTAPIFENLNGSPSELRIFDSSSDNQRYTINRYIDESGNVDGQQNSWGPEDSLDDVDEVYFTFSVKRDFLNDLEPERKEQVKYWVEIVSDSDASFKKYFYPTSSDLGEDSVSKTDINFVNTEAYATVNSDGSFSWSPESMDWVAGDYTVTAYIQDNAGNIRTSQKSVELVNQFDGYVPPVIPPDPTTPSEIVFYDVTSLHEGGTNSLVTVDGTTPVFYVNSYFTANNTEQYFDTGDNSIDIVVEVNNLINAQKVIFTRNNNDLPAAFDAELSNFDANNSVTLSVPVSAFAENATGTYTYGNATSDIKIEVITRDIEDGSFNISNVAAGDRSFKIDRPEEPIWPVIVGDIINVVPHCISPGNPSWAYDAETNPANEAGMAHNGIDKPFNEISFTIGNSSVDYEWSLRVYDPDDETKVRSISGNNIAGIGNFSETMNFANLTNSNNNIVGALASKLLNVELKVVPEAYSDTGYIAPENAYSYATTRVDNENPQILGTNAENYIPNPAGNTFYLANGINSFNFDIETSEYLKETDWTALVYDEDTLELVPGANVVITATPTNLTDNFECPTTGTVGYKNFNITATIDNFADGVLENVNYTLILRTPNDFGGNPGRYNNPPYPFDADAWHTDSSEAFVHFIVLREAPQVVSASGQFYYINSDADMVLDKAAEAGEFQFSVSINGYPGITPIEAPARGVENYLFDVDFSNFTGATISAPQVNDLGNGNWEITYTGSYTGIANGIANGQVIEIPVELSLGFTTGDVAVHEYDFTYNGVTYDNVAPTFNDNLVPNTVDENTVLTLSYEITDAIAGVQADKVTISCSDNTLIADNTIATALGGNIYQWQITIPNNYETNTLTFDFVAQDMLDNEETHSHTIDITPMPTVSNVAVLNNSPENQNIIKDGDVVDVTFELTDSERIDAVTITLNDGQVFNVASYEDGQNIFKINSFDASNYDQYEVVAANVEISHPYNGLDDSSEADSDPALTTPFVDEEQVVINDIKFFVNGVENVNNEFSAEMENDFYVEATFVAYTNHVNTVNNVVLHYTPTATAGAPTLMSTVFESEEVNGYVKNTYTYRWEQNDFDYNEFISNANPPYGYVELNFSLEVGTRYDFTAIYNEPAVAVAIQDIPTVSNVNIYNVEGLDQYADQGNHIDIIENNNKVKVTFELTDADRISQVEITLNNGTVETVTSGLVNGLNTVIIDDFGIGNPEYATLKVEDLTITHPYEYYETESSTASTNTDVPFVDNNQVVISDLRVYVNGNETENYFSIDPNQNIRFEADVIAYQGQLTTSNVVLTYKGIQATSAQYESDVFESEPVTGFEKHTYTYSWDNADFDFANFENQTTGYEVVDFVVEARSDFNFVATPYNQDMVAINIPEYTFNGIAASRYVGYDPQGWFAPEHDVELTMTVNSVLADINPIAEFDNITNDFPDTNWINGTVVTTSTNPIPGVTIYNHQITWVRTPDVQACWNTYDDGDNIQIEVRYEDFFAVNPISIFKSIKIDLEVPTYSDYTIVQAASNINDYATANTLPGINNLSNQVNSYNFDLTLNDPQDLDSYQFDGSLYVKRIVEDMNGVSVAETGVTLPSVDPTWTVTLLGSELINVNQRALIWKITPVDNTAVENTDIVTIQFNELEDLVNHKNYAGENYNSPSNRYLAQGPQATVEFIASQADVDGITAFQYDGLDRMNAATSPYISNGQRIGVILDVQPLATDNANVTSVEILADHYNNANQGWIALAYDAVNDLYFLNSDILVNSTVGWKELEYRITYSTNEISQQSVANVFNLIDGNTTSLDEIYVWSQTLGENGMYYVTPGDLATIKVIFNSDAPLTGTVAKPYVTLTDFNNILDMPSPYVVPQNNITWDGMQWVAELTGIPVVTNHNQTSQVVSVSATNITGQSTPASTKTISYAGSGPIVPLIQHAELVTGNATNYLAVSGSQTVDPVVNVYINTQFQEYIDNVTIDPVAGLTFGAYTVAPTVMHNSKWLVTFPVTITDPALFAENQMLTLNITSFRDPFDNILTNVFEHEMALDVEVDGNDFDILINNPGTQNPVLGSFDLTIDFTNFGESLNPAYVPVGTDFVVSGNQLVNDMTPVINGNTAVLTITANDFTADAATLGNTDLTVTYTNIYGFEKSENINILLDATAPQVIANGVTFNSPVGPASYNWGDVIIYDQDFTSLVIELEDPEMFGTDGIGNINANFNLATIGVTPNTAAINNVAVNFNGSVAEFVFNAGYSGFDLAEGDYQITINATDALGNNFTDTKTFRYAHSPAGVSATTDPAITLNSGNDIELEFLVNDPDGVVNTVEFQVYLDADNDGDYTDDLGNLVLQANDAVYPYGFNWDLSSPQYTSYLYNANYDGNNDGDNLDLDENIRNYIVRVLTTSSQMRSVSDAQFTYSVADVTAPEVSDVLAAGSNSLQLVYDYITPANNNVNLTALVGAWTDVDYVELTLNGDVLVYDMVNPVNWTYDANDIGAVVITAKAYDFVGNVSAEADFSTVLEIVNPSYDKFYDLTLVDYTNFDSDNTIADGTIYSPSNPLIQNNLRVYAVYPNGLEGISEIQFFVNRIDTATGNVIATLPVNNDAAVNPQYGNTNVVNPANCYDATANVWNSWITVDPNLYTNNGNYDGSDYSYEFFAVLIDSYTNNEVIPQAGIFNDNADFRVDYMKPELVVNNASVTHTSYAYYNGNTDRLVFDYVDFDGLNINNFFVDYNAVNVADNANITIDALTNTVSIPWTGLNTIAGEGIVTYNVTVTDANGNVSEITPIDVYVDNQAPQTAIASLAYMTDADNGGEAMNQLHNFDGNPIAVMADNAENLTIQIDRAQILGLSTEDTENWANQTQPWYANTNDDIYPPVKLYRNIDGAGWNLIAYDHEVDANNMYQFNVTVDTGAMVEFAVIAEDTRGNVEGDLIPFDGIIDNYQVDLTVNVLYPTDITTTIVNHNADDVISGLELLTANVATPAGIQSVEFQYNDGVNWMPLGSDDSMADVDYQFSIANANIPFALIPGVHIEITDSALNTSWVELANVNDIWTADVTLARETYVVNYYVDANNDGVIDAVEMANNFVVTENINADGFALQFDTSIIPDGSYLFRAVPFDNLVATDDQAAAVEMNLIIDNSAPVFNLTALNYVMLDSYKTLAENVEFTLDYANPNDVHTVQAWLVDVNNPANTYQIVNDVYAAYDVRPTDFSLVLAGVADGNYYLDVTVQDFVFNANNQSPALGDNLYIDTNAPVITAVNNPFNMSGIYTETHSFTVAYNDYLAQLLDANSNGLGVKAMQATFTHNATVDLVDVKVSDDGANLVFEWTPSQAMMNEVINGQDNILVNVDLTLTDHNDYVSAIFNAGNFTLRSDEVGAKIMVVSDFRNGAETFHQTNVTNNNEITDVIGGNNINLYAFLPEGNNVIDPNNVRFEYWDGTNWMQFAANAVWTPIANFAGNGTVAGYAEFMSVNWNIANMDGDYTVRTVSEYNFGEVVNETNLHIWNSTIVPEITLSTLEGQTTTEVNRGSEYILSIGNFNSSNPEFFNQVNYMYRFLDENDNVASPWNQLSGFVANEYNWTIGMDYLFAEKVQIAVQVEDIFNNVDDQVSFMANGGNPYVVDIIDSQAPMVTDLTVNQAGNPVVAGATVAIANALDLAITVDNPVLDLASLVINLDGNQVHSLAYDTNNQVDPTLVNYSVDISALTTGTYQIEVVTADFVGHTYNEIFAFSVDTDAPTGALVLAENDNGSITRGMAYTFNANAMDNVSTQLTINYFWSDAAANVWNPIALDANGQWIIPQTWTIGANYDFKAEIEDEYNNVGESIVTYQVFDNITPLVANSMNTLVDDSIFNMNDEITLTFDVDATNIINGNIELQYADVLNGNWMSLGFTPAALNAGLTEVTFANLGLASGFYNFKAIVSDLAIPANQYDINLGSMVYYDADAPEVFFTNIDNDSEFVLGEMVAINADVNYTDGTNEIAPQDVASVEFKVNGQSHAIVENAPYTYVWNTALLANVGTYTIEAIVTDNDGFINNTLQNVVLVTPNENDPYAVITAFEFDNEAISTDKMYAKVTNWGNNVTAVVAQYTSDNINWVDFAINTVNNDPYYEFDFNAEAIQNAIAVKVNVMMNNDEESSLVYPLNVTYNQGEFELAPANGNIEIHENNLMVVDTDSMPNVIRVDENGYAGYETINEDYEFNLFVNANNELPGYWLSGVANGAAWIKFAELDPMAASNGAIVNYNNPYWFTMLDNEMPLADHYAQLTDQVLVNSNIAGNATYTLPLTATVAVEGDIVALAWDAVLADFVEIDVEYNETDASMTFTAPVNTVVTVGQYLGFEMFVTEFAPVNNDVFVEGTTLWTLPNVAMNFNVYHEETEMGYQLPAGFGLGNITITLNNSLNNVNNIALVNGVVSFDLVNMMAGQNELEVHVEMNGFHANQTLYFFVDDSMPTIAFESTSILSATNRTLTATIEDAETGLMDYNLVVTNNDPAVNTVLNVPMNEITVTGNEFSYEMTVEELVTLVPQPMRSGRNSREVASLNVQWTAVNNLNLVNVMAANVTANVVVNRPQITIHDAGFENGWWLNPAMSNELLMSVVPADGRTIALEDINVSILAITDLNPAGILIQTSNPVATANENEYVFGFAQLQLPNSLGIKVRVNAIDDIDVNNVAEQTFSLDYMDPVVTATAPTNPVVNFGSDAQIAFSFNDPQGHFIDDDLVQHFSGASGIDISTLVLTLDGNVVNGQVSNGSVAYAASDLVPGAHTAIASVSDFVGNTASATVNFEIVGGPAPLVDFSPLANGSWWITTANNYEFDLTVESGHTDTALQSVVANIIQLPNNEVIQGPFSVSLENGQGTINFHGGIVTPGQNAIKVEVIAENDWAIQTVSSQTFPIDNSRPELTIVNPEINYSVMVGNNVNVNIMANDNMSGLAMSSIKVTSLNGDFTVEEIDSDSPEAFNLAVSTDDLLAGTYVIEAQAKDMAGNVTTVTRNFAITAPAPIIAISALDASNGWVNTQNNNAISFTVDGNGYELDNASIMASIIAMPNNEVIYEPFTVQADNGIYNINLHGGLIPADANTVKVLVMASNVAGGNAVSNQSYPIDSYIPTIEFVSPLANTTFTHAENMFVDVMMTLSDIMPEVKAMASSGLDMLEIKVFDNDNVTVIDTVKNNVANSYACRVPVNGLGQYRIEATIYDRAGNSNTQMMNFTVDMDWANVDLMFTAKPYMYPSPLQRGDVGTFVIPTTKEAQVTIEIFDFAGKLVREMSHNSIGGDTNNMIQFDGRTNDGKRLARGAYFARINIVDGAKEINKVVKIAIQ